MGIRDSLLALAPPWLSDPQQAGGKFLYSIGLNGDALLDKAQQSLFARMPGLADPSALPLIGADRLIPRGPGETDAQFAMRLRGAFDLWQRAGINAGVLRQVLGYLNVYKPRARIVTDSSIWTTQRPGVDPSIPASYQDGEHNWNWDNNGDPHPPAIEAWWRWWLVLYSTSTSGSNWAGTPRKWGDPGKWGDKSKAWGVGIPSTIFRSIRTIIGTCKRAGSWCRWMVISLDDSLFDPALPGDNVINPNGGWHSWGKVSGNLYVRARPAQGRYADGWATTGATEQKTFPIY